MNIYVKKLKEEAILPTHGSDAAAGYDLYACLPDGCVTINPGECIKIGTGLTMELPKNYYAGIYARSGLATKQGLRLANCVGICDEDYRGEYIVPIYNDSDHKQQINHGDRIAQMILQPYQILNFIEQEELKETERGIGGFGSTG